MRKALKAIFFTCAAVLVVMFFLSLLGIIDNNRGNAFGFFYKTDYVSFLLTMAMVYIAITDGWLTWLGEMGLICLDGYMLWLHGKTGFACLFVLTFIILWRYYRRNGGVPFRDKKSYGLLSYVFFVIYLPVRAADWCAAKLKLINLKPVLKRVMVFSFPICFALNLLLVFTYQPLKSFWESVPVLGTFKDRLIFGLLGFQEYPVRLFGNDMSVTLLERSERFDSLFFTLDSSYLKFLLDYGLVPFIILFGVLTLIMVWFYKKDYTLGLFIMSIIAVDATVELQIYNWALVIVFLIIALLFPGKGGVENCNKLSFAHMPTSRRWCLGITSLAVLALVGVWSVTAYQISGWRGWTPEYNATLVVPGSFLGAGDDVLDEAVEYLMSHDDSVCIVGSEEDITSLTTMGVDEGRIYVSSYDNIDDMLTNSYSLIHDNGLPSRMTVCAYSMQQSRISRRASALHIPVSSVSVRPESDYLSLFTDEQWRLLCGD